MDINGAKLLEDREKSRISAAECNGITSGHDESIPTDGLIPVEPLLVLKGRLYGTTFKVLKDEGCNKMWFKMSFWSEVGTSLRLDVNDSFFCRLQKGITEETSEIIMNGTI